MKRLSKIITSSFNTQLLRLTYGIEFLVTQLHATKTNIADFKIHSITTLRHMFMRILFFLSCIPQVVVVLRQSNFIWYNNTTLMTNVSIESCIRVFSQFILSSSESIYYCFSFVYLAPSIRFC